MLFDSLDKENNAKLVRKDFPEWYDPCCHPFSRGVFPSWIYERKLDGERCIAYGNEGNVRLMSRNKGYQPAIPGNMRCPFRDKFQLCNRW